MHTGVDTLIVFHVYCDFFSRPQLSSVCRLVSLEISPDHIVCLACGHPLGEFAVMVGINLPMSFLLAGQTNLDAYSINRPVAGSPHRAENHRIRFVMPMVRECGGSDAKSFRSQTQCQKKAKKRHRAGTTGNKNEAEPNRRTVRRGHRRQFPPLRRPPRIPPRLPPSVRWG